MANHNLSLPFWEGFLVSQLDAIGDELHVCLIPDPACPLICSHCDAQAFSIHETCCRLVRDLPMAGMAVFLQVQVSRLRCPNCCRCCTQRISWLTPCAGIASFGRICGAVER